jgi:hypothetical protein
MVLLPRHPRNFLPVIKENLLLVLKLLHILAVNLLLLVTLLLVNIIQLLNLGVEKPAAAAAEKPTAAEPPPLLKMVATFDPYTAELDDGSDVLVPKHDVDVYVDRQKGIQVAELIGKFSENLLLGSHQKVKYMWWNRRINDFIEIGVNSQPNLDVALEKYGTGNHILFLGCVGTRADPEGDGLTEGNGNIPSSIKDWISPSKVGTRNFSPNNTAKVTPTDSLKRNRKLLCKRTCPRKNASA